MINTSMAPDVAFANLPRETQEHLMRLRANVYFLDANSAAAKLGLGNRINTFIMLNFFNLTQVIDPKVAAESAKAAIEKTYKKKGMDVVQANWAAVDTAADYLHRYEIPSSVSQFAPDFVPAMTADAPNIIAATLGEWQRVVAMLYLYLVFVLMVISGQGNIRLEHLNMKSVQLRNASQNAI